MFKSASCTEYPSYKCLCRRSESAGHFPCQRSLPQRRQDVLGPREVSAGPAPLLLPAASTNAQHPPGPSRALEFDRMMIALALPPSMLPLHTEADDPGGQGKAYTD